MGLRVSSEHYSVDGIRWKVDIYDSTFSGAVVSHDDMGFEIEWQEESDNFLAPIKSSTCTYTMFDDGTGTFSDLREDIAESEEDRFQLVISKHNGTSFDLYWCGVIMADLVEWDNANAPRKFTIYAKDGLNRIKSIPFDNIDSSPFTTAPQTFMYIIEKILAKNGLAAYHTGTYIKVSADWYDTQMSTSQKQRVLERLRIWGEMLREDIPEEQTKTTNVNPLYCGAVLESLLKLLACRIIYSEGCYHIQQVSNFVDTTQDEANYNSSGTFSSISSAVSNRVTNVGSTDDKTTILLDGGKFGYHAAYKRCKLTARGYLDIRGAYIESAEVNRSSTTYTETLQLGTIIGGVYATASKTTSGNTNYFKAENAGTAGNSITLVFDGIHSVTAVVNDWNTANPNNKVIHISGNPSTVHSSGTTVLSGGDGDGKRYLEIDFDLNIFTADKTKSSNIITTVDVKVICGSYRVKGRAGYTNAEIQTLDWTTTSTDKFTYTLYGYNDNYKKIQLITSEIPFAEETSCTCEITVTLTKNNSAAWVDPTDPTIWPANDWDFYATIRRVRAIAWDSDIDVLADAEVFVDNPDNPANSVEFDFGKLVIGDNPIVQRSVSSKNGFEVLNSLSTWKRPNVWSASFDTDYNLVTTMLMEAMALRKQPTEKYMGGFMGVYAAHKSIYYDSTTWVMNALRFESTTNKWDGTWFAITYDRTNIVQSEEKLRPTSSLKPVIKPFTTQSNNDFPDSTDRKGNGAIPYTTGTTINAFDVDALPKGQFMTGDKMMVYHPKRFELLAEFVVDADTSPSDTSITIVSDTADKDIPVGAILQHDSREVVASDKGRFEQTFVMKSLWVNYRVINIDDSEGSSTQNLTTDDYIVIVVPDDINNLHTVRLPLIADSVIHDKSAMFIVKSAYGAVAVAPNSSDTSARIWTNGTTGSLTSLNITAGNQRAFITDGTHWHTISF